MGKKKSTPPAPAPKAAAPAKPVPASIKQSGDKFFDVFLKGVHVGSDWAKDEAQAIDRVHTSTGSKRSKQNYAAKISTHKPPAPVEATPTV